MTVKRGDIYYADLSPVVGSEQGGIRPVLIVQNDVGNRFSPTVIAAAITSQKYKTNLPTHIRVNADGCGLAKDSIVLLEQVRTLDKKRLKEKMGALGGALAMKFLGIQQAFAYFYGGTSLLIMVGVVLDTLKQIESYLLMRHYDGLMKTGRIQGRH